MAEADERVKNDRLDEIDMALTTLKEFKENKRICSNTSANCAVDNLLENLEILGLSPEDENYKDIGITQKELKSLIDEYGKAELKD